MRFTTARWVDLPAGRFALLEAGAGGRPLLLVHGFGGAKEDFADHLGWLAAAGWHVVAPDLRGHGFSPAPDDEQAYGLDRFARDQVELVDALGWDRFVLLGHSMGGMVAQLVALDHGDRLEALVLMNTGHGAFDLDPATAELGAAIARDEGMAALKEVMDETGSPLDNPAFDRTVTRRPGHQEFSDRKMLTCSPAMYGAVLRQLPALAPRLDRLRALDVPTLVLIGEVDDAFLEPSHELAEAIPGAELVVLPGGGHSPQFESPTAWAEALHAFLNRL